MDHYDIFQSVYSCATYFCAVVTAQTLNTFEEYLPDLLIVDLVWVAQFLVLCRVYKWCILGTIFFDDLFGCVVRNILEHADSNQVVVDVSIRLIARVHVDGIKDGHKVFLAQSIDKIVDDQL